MVLWTKLEPGESDVRSGNRRGFLSLGDAVAGAGAAAGEVHGHEGEQVNYSSLKAGASGFYESLTGLFSGVCVPAVPAVQKVLMFRAAFSSRSWIVPQAGHVHPRTDNGNELRI